MDPSKDLQELISRLAVALGIGLLIGLERGWRRRQASPGSRAAGIRTFAISGLLGGVIAALALALSSQASAGVASAAGGIVLGLGFAAHAAVVTLFTRDENRAVGAFSATTAIAGMLTFALGAYALLGDLRVSAGTAVAAAGLLAFREELHGWLENITWPELRSGLILLAMTFLGLPIMPDHPVGPFGGVNPRDVWIIAIVLAGVSFLGYAAVKNFGARRGLLLAAAAGALASSTAVTIASARHAAAGEGSPRLLAAGVAVASVIMFIRVAAIVAALKPDLLMLVAPTLVAASLVAAGFAIIRVYWPKTDTGSHQSVDFRNPFDFLSVVGFAFFLGLIVMLGRAVGETFGATGALAGAIFVGIADIDAITVSMARLTPEILSTSDAAVAILGAVASNTVSKIAIGAVIGRGAFAVDIAAMALLCLLVGAIALWLTFVFAA
jgi:uncharacterized membrane protein (DUF4010 family)